MEETIMDPMKREHDTPGSEPLGLSRSSTKTPGRPRGRPGSGSYGVVVNPLACVNGAERGTPSLACAPVVTRILYVVAGLRGAAGETVNVAFPLLATGAAAILTHFTKLLLETCSVPLQTAFDMLTVTEDGLAA